MRFIYVCAECGHYIGELELENWDETMLGFDTLNGEEKKELVAFDLERQQGMVRAICDACYKEKATSQSFYHQVDYPGIH